MTLSMNIKAFNSLSQLERETALMSCCFCIDWAGNVANKAPFESLKRLLSTCHDHWSNASEEAVLEAFTGHPQIGDLDALRNKYADTASAEQGQVVAASEWVLVRLKEENDEYFRRFGFIFIVCATGKSAAEMLDLLEARIVNSREQEIANGARE
ncbi:MAG: 2-oxo-4-hydroxy-4-carboxy-5-ureidoimidazoline decarboxylase, partial [Candidatus Azotimanducaceae bacterium]